MLPPPDGPGGGDVAAGGGRGGGGGGGRGGWAGARRCRGCGLCTRDRGEPRLLEGRGVPAGVAEEGGELLPPALQDGAPVGLSRHSALRRCFGGSRGLRRCRRSPQCRLRLLLDGELVDPGG